MGKEDKEPAPASAEASAGASRRDFLTRTGTLAISACAVTVLAGSARLAWPDFHAGTPERFALGRLADFRIGTLTWLRERDLFVARDEQGIGAHSARCTHLGCVVRRSTQGFFCPCHGARYDGTGQVVSGPARTALPWYHLWLEPDGRIWVDTSRETAAGTRRLAPHPGA